MPLVELPNIDICKDLRDQWQRTAVKHPLLDEAQGVLARASSEIGYWVAPWARGEGLAVEAVQRIAHWLLLKQHFERMVLRAALGNTASHRVAEKAGFTREGIARNAGFTNTGRVDLVVFSLIPADVETAETNEEAS